MREPHATGPLPPRDWSEAFAALPPETPSADALSSVFARIPATTPAPSRRQWWIGAAAMLAVAAMVPMWVARHASDAALDRGVRGGVSSAAPLRHRSSTTAPAMRTEVASHPVALDARPRGSRDATGPRRDDGGKGSAIDAGAFAQERFAKAVRQRDTSHRKPHRNGKASPASDPADARMEPLYAESARLEALLALARDDRAASATAVALGSDFEARVASIDAALAQPALSPQHRLALWRERVSALRAYASFESTRRALAASGERYDAMLVSID